MSETEFWQHVYLRVIESRFYENTSEVGRAIGIARTAADASIRAWRKSKANNYQKRIGASPADPVHVNGQHRQIAV